MIIPLSERQTDVIGLLARGLTYEQTADMLGVSVHTVKKYAWAARVRLEAKNTAHAVAISLHAGLIVP